MNSRAFLVLSVWVFAIGILSLKKWRSSYRSSDSVATTELAGKGTRCVVYKVVDGDTINVHVDQEIVKIRLWGVDAPEMSQSFGGESRSRLCSFLINKHIEYVEIKKDRYGRSVSRVYANGEDVSLWLVSNGLAWWFSKYAPEDRALENAEREARKKSVGVWGSKNPTPPWEYRSR